MEGAYKTLPRITHCISLRTVFMQWEPALERLKGAFTVHFWYLCLSTWFIFMFKDTVIHGIDHGVRFVLTLQASWFVVYIYKTKSYTFIYGLHHPGAFVVFFVVDILGLSAITFPLVLMFHIFKKFRGYMLLQVFYRNTYL